MADLLGLKVGDRLFVKRGHHDKGSIVAVDRITPTGRVITKRGEFNPNGRLRGSGGWLSEWARPATEDDIAGIYRHGLVQKLESVHSYWNKLSAEDLKTATTIIEKYKLPQS